jgi:hypothetical protein
MGVYKLVTNRLINGRPHWRSTNYDAEAYLAFSGACWFVQTDE